MANFIRVVPLIIGVLLLALGCSPNASTALPSPAAIQTQADARTAPIESPQTRQEAQAGPTSAPPASPTSAPIQETDLPTRLPQTGQPVSPAARPTPPREAPATAETLAPAQAAVPAAGQQAFGGDGRILPIYPPASWAKEELGRRGFVRNPQKKVIVIDPGHGGPDVGAAHGSFAEKNANLMIALQLKELLEADGFQVLVTREADVRPYYFPAEVAHTPRQETRADLQSRLDLANAVNADLFICIHNNGSSDRAQAGAEIWYAPDRPFGDSNWLLAQSVLQGILGELRKAGYAAPDRGLKNGSEFRVFNGRVFPLFVLGNSRVENQPMRPTMMPGILGESLFLSNDYEANLLMQQGIREAIAQGYFRGIKSYFAQVR